MSLTSLPALASRFSLGTRLYLHRIAEVDEPSTGRGRRYWVVSRGLCRFFKIPLLAGASTARQLEALNLQIERLSPFSRTGFHFNFGADAIALWLWDAGAVADAADAIDIDLKRVPVVPETAVQVPGDGVRLIECLDGVEGQIWDNGSLVASRWWAALPDNRSWVLFQRGASVGPDRLTLAPPTLTALPWLGRPWTTSPSSSWSGIANTDLRLAAAGVAVVFLVGYAYLAAQWLRLSWAISATEQSIAASTANIAPITQARSNALDNEIAIQRLHQLDPYPSQLALMAKIGNILPKNETHFTEWTYDPGQLEITVSAAHPLDATFFVSTLERLDRFKGVAAERAGGDNTLRIRLTVEPR